MARKKAMSKTRTFNGKQFRLKEQKSTKEMAGKSASASRKKGKMARVVGKKSATGTGSDKTWGIYTRNK